MSRLFIAYSMIGSWLFGWLTAQFGLGPSGFAALIFFIPVYFAWRMNTSARTTTHREFAYLAVVTAVAVSATTFLIMRWDEAGKGQLVRFDREVREFQRYISSVPEFRDVEVAFTRRKGGRVYLKGHVADSGSHDRLLRTIERMVRSSEWGYGDGVSFPGRSQ